MRDFALLTLTTFVVVIGIYTISSGAILTPAGTSTQIQIADIAPTSTPVLFIARPTCIKSQATTYDQILLESIYCQQKVMIKDLDLLVNKK